MGLFFKILNIDFNQKKVCFQFPNMPNKWKIGLFETYFNNLNILLIWVFIVFYILKTKMIYLNLKIIFEFV